MEAREGGLVVLTGVSLVLVGLVMGGGVAWYALGLRRADMLHLDQRLARLAPVDAPVHRRKAAAAMPRRFEPLFARAQIEPTHQVLGLLGGASVALGVAGYFLAEALLALGMFAAVPLGAFLFVQRRATRRIDAFVEALPYYVDGVRQLQAIGASLPQALQRAMNDAPEAVRRYLDPVARRLDLGVPANEAMQQVADRLRVPELSMFAAAIKTNIRYGGSITGILANLAGILRERIRIKRDLLAATSEARVSGKVLIGMPVVAMVLLVMINPEYLTFFMSDPRGHRWGTIAILLQGAGMLVMRRQMQLVF